MTESTSNGSLICRWKIVYPLGDRPESGRAPSRGRRVIRVLNGLSPIRKFSVSPDHRDRRPFELAEVEFGQGWSGGLHRHNTEGWGIPFASRDWSRAIPTLGSIDRPERFSLHRWQGFVSQLKWTESHESSIFRGLTPRIIFRNVPS